MTRALLLGVAALLIIGLAPQAADAAPPMQGDCVQNPYLCGVARPDGLGVGLGEQRPGRTRPAKAQQRPVAVGGAAFQPTVVTEVRYEPACSGNYPEIGRLVCASALVICADPEAIAHWVWRRTRNTVTGATTAWMRQGNPPYACVGPDDPVVAIPPEVMIQAIVRREFRTYGLASGRTEVEPTDRTLVNVPTRFSTATGSYDLPVRNILGRDVHVRADAVRYDWDFGDGTGLADGGPGQRGTDQVAHTYEDAAQVAASVDVTWRGSFRIAGIAETYTIDELVTIEGEPVPLTVLTARSELVSQ